MDSKRANVLSQPFSLEVVFGSLFCQLLISLIQSDEDDQLYIASVILVFFGCINYTTIHISQPRFKLLGYSPALRSFNDSRIYIETGVVVVISYVLLLGVNWSYIWLAVFPAIAIGFIFTLCNELNRQSELQQHDDGDGSGGGEEGCKETKKAERQEAAALVLYWVLCFLGQFHISDSLVVSQFLLFFSFMLGALTRMMTRLELTGAAPGVAPASVLLRKASLLVLLVTLHTFAAELLGENVILFILPELMPVVLWFSLHLDGRGGSLITADKIKSHKNIITIFKAASVPACAFLAVSMDEHVLSWCTKALVSCGISGLLLYYSVFMLCQWPGLDDSTATTFVEEAVKLLQFWANILLSAAAVLGVAIVAAVCLAWPA